jgi:TolB-like protein
MMLSKTVPQWRFLGDVSIPGPDGELTPHLGKKAIALLAYLALAREGAGRDELAALLWPDPDPSRSKHNLRQCLLSLRKALGDQLDGLLEVSDDRLALNHAAVEVDALRLIEIDAGRMAPAEELLDLCRGPFLRGLTARARPFDDWASAQRDRLTVAAGRALGLARAAAVRAGRRAEAARLTAALAELGLGPAMAPGAEMLPGAIVPAPGSSRDWVRRAATAVAAATLVFAGLWGAYSVSPDVRRLVNAYVLGSSSPPAIAVLPFTAVDSTKVEAGLAGGVTLGVTYALYAITAKELFVVTPAAVAQELGHEQRIARAKDLGVRYLISGSVEVLAGDIRVDVECLDADTGGIIWRDRFYQPMAEAFKLQDDITLRILKELDIELSTAERNRIQYLDDTRNLYAWLSAAKGVKYLIKVNRDDVKIAKEAYQTALDLDSDYLSARRGLAWVDFLSVRLGWAEDSAAAIRDAKNQLGIVLRKRPDDGTTKSLEGAILLLEAKYDEAILAGEFAVEKLPGSADAWAVLAHTLTYVGGHERAFEMINDKAMKLSEKHPAWYRWTKGRALRMAGRYEESIEVLEEDLGRGAPSLAHLVEMTASYSAAGRMSDARRIATEIRQLVPGFSASAWLEHPRIKIPEIQSQEFEYLSKAGL